MKLLLLLLLLAPVFLAACGEKPQRLEVTSEQAAAADQKQEPRRSRTMGQNEAARIYH